MRRLRMLQARRRRVRGMTVVLAGLSVALLPGLSSAAVSAARVEQPRSYGHVLGDVLTQRVAIDEAAGKPQVPVLPVAARVNVWFDRLPARVEKDAQGQSWLRLDYQIVNAPRDLEVASLPALKIDLKSGDSVTVPEWPVSIGSLTPAEVFGKGDLQAMRPDHAAAPYATGPVRERMQLWALLFALTLAAWLSWFLWRNFRDANRMPFARAAREVKRLERRGAAGSEAWICVHRAFNHAAGRVVQPESLPTLFARAPYLESLRPEIERFYNVSSERFFAPTQGASTVELHGFCRQLKGAEKRRGNSRDP